MSHFYGSMQGSRGTATRCGTATSGITAHIRGWNVGVRVLLDVDEYGRDRVTVNRTGGSNDPGGQCIAQWTGVGDESLAIMPGQGKWRRIEPPQPLDE